MLSGALTERIHAITLQWIDFTSTEDVIISSVFHSAINILLLTFPLIFPKVSLYISFTILLNRYIPRHEREMILGKMIIISSNTKCHKFAYSKIK